LKTPCVSGTMLNITVMLFYLILMTLYEGGAILKPILQIRKPIR